MRGCSASPSSARDQHEGDDRAGFCRRHDLVLIRITSAPANGDRVPPGTEEDCGWVDIRLASAGLAVIVRPDRVIAAAGTRSRLPRLPWHVPAAAARGHAAAPHPLAHPDPAGSLPAPL